MFKKSKVKSTTRITERRQKSSIASDNLYVSPSFIGKFQRFATRKQKSRFSKSTLNVEPTEAESKKVTKESRLASNLPKDAAVHFGNFYGVQGNANKPRADKIESLLESTTPCYKVAPRLEFTRQMVHKLERTAGTEEYARQVSALLEETVEPPHFKLHSLSMENSIPDGRYNPTGYPLWYKDPYKMPFNPDEIYKLLRERYDNASSKARDIFDEETSEKEEEEASDDEQIEDDNLQDNGATNLAREKSLNVLFDEPNESSSSATEAKDTDSKESIENLDDSKNVKDYV